jgi:hypothetical protein
VRKLGVEVSYKKLYDWFRRWGYRKKVPQANGGENECAGAGDVEKKGLWAALQAEGLIPIPGKGFLNVGG